jgi:crotonobetainyl-CoA:carnitine CoA-transferase CaiB-like acyl-CoA transferase
VTCSVTAFGTSEAALGLPGYDFLAQAMGGLMSVTGEEDGRPLKTGAAVVDLVCGLLAVIGIQAALAERERTGKGRHVEVSLMDAALLSLLNQGSAWVLGGIVPHRRGNRHPSITPYETFDAADRPLAVAVGNDRLFQRLCAVLGLGELAADERFATNSARVAHADALAARLGPVFATRPAAEWIAELSAAAVPAGPINDVAEAFSYAESLGMEPVTETDGYPLPSPPLRIDGERPEVTKPPPKLDEHGEEIRAWLKSSAGHPDRD